MVLLKHMSDQVLSPLETAKSSPISLRVKANILKWPVMSYVIFRKKGNNYKRMLWDARMKNKEIEKHVLNQ